MLRFCAPGGSYAVAWTDGGFSRCFLEVVGSISTAGLLYLLGLSSIVLGQQVRGRVRTQRIGTMLFCEVNNLWCRPEYVA